jgi:Protein of unknown function (DUF3892)
MSKEITCVNRRDRPNVHEHILAVGGVHLGVKWRKTQLEVITDIENNWESYYVTRNQGAEQVIVAVSAYGHKYIKTASDGVRPEKLLSLEECR